MCICSGDYLNCLAEEEVDHGGELEAVRDLMHGALRELDPSNGGVVPHKCFREVGPMHILIHSTFSYIIYVRMYI